MLYVSVRKIQYRLKEYRALGLLPNVSRLPGGRMPEFGRKGGMGGGKMGPGKMGPGKMGGGPRGGDDD